jgi:diguanylate cyclase
MRDKLLTTWSQNVHFAGKKKGVGLDILRGSAMDNFVPTSDAIDARTDPQTGLPSRVALQEDVRRRLAEAQRHGNRLSVILIRIGSLGELLGRGESSGNLVLRACTQFFVAATREMDLVTRYDVDVFGIELPGAALMDAVTVAKRLKGHIESCPLQLLDEKLTFRISVGAAEAQPGEETKSLLKRAEEALQASVSSINNHVQLHNGISVESAVQKTDQRPILAAR